MEKQSLVINVFGRQFPATVDADEAEVISEAAKTINAKIKAFKAQYKTQDDLDIAIMCCLDIMTEYLAHKNKHDAQIETVMSELSNLDQTLDHLIDPA